MFNDEQIEEIVDLLTSLDERTKLYLGCDSVRYKKGDQWFARYATVFIVHINGNNGCRIFSHKSVERDYEKNKSRPKMRMIREVQKTCELYMQLIPFIEGFDIEIHLDVNTDEKHGSSCAASEAAGYVLGMTGLPQEKIKLKPHSWGASFGADHIANKAS